MRAWGDAGVRFGYALLLAGPSRNLDTQRLKPFRNG
jgi:hypothetical protein